MIPHNLGFPRIGAHRELKFSLEKFWKNEITAEELVSTGRLIRKNNWQIQQESGIQLIPVNDFSYYDHVLDISLMTGNIPPRFLPIVSSFDQDPFRLYFAMARGLQDDTWDIPAMEMTKWFNTNYHYIVPEFYASTQYRLFSSKVLDEFSEAKAQGINAKPVLLGPVSYVLMGKIKDDHLSTFSILESLLPVYQQVLQQLESMGCKWIQIDEPMLASDLQPQVAELFQMAYHVLSAQLNSMSVMLATYFGEITHNLGIINQLPVDALHVDLVSAPSQLEELLHSLNSQIILSLGIIDGRNIWKNDFEQSVKSIKRSIEIRGKEKIMLAPSCSLLHVPYDLELETNVKALPAFVKTWMAFARQKLHELRVLEVLTSEEQKDQAWAFEAYAENIRCMADRRTSDRIKNPIAAAQARRIASESVGRKSTFAQRYAVQQKSLNLPLLPTTTIGSFPQTAEVRKIRNQYRRGLISEAQYKRFMHAEIEKCIRLQEELGLDVLVHGEFERNDMVEYFGEQLACFAQSLTHKPVKGMLTGPLTILKWSFVRNDQPWYDTLMQIAAALNEEVLELQAHGIKIIQVDEPALRESLPLRQKDWPVHLQHAIRAFHVTVAGISDTTQIHTHMCYSEFNDIIAYIAQLDADVISIEASRSGMELLQAFYQFKYPNAIGPGIYDIHSPRIPSVEEMSHLIRKALEVIPVDQLWINPDCGLKTRGWPETIASLKNMVQAAQQIRSQVLSASKI